MERVGLAWNVVAVPQDRQRVKALAPA
jgi:hypothetical protein